MTTIKKLKEHIKNLEKSLKVDNQARLASVEQAQQFMRQRDALITKCNELRTALNIAKATEQNLLAEKLTLNKIINKLLD